ncbi:hypothetical protein CCL16_11755 [Pseudomonas syringae]|uniref:hypothetical protein n=1 Tax=Pseudomonas TaxID=286 RepID=UPI000730290C|nr:MULTISPECIES: hypothetical protein [Pseudomonas]KTB91324.1 hypothetical protein AO072_21275 [Pseudomonas syringae ICMP 13102]KTB91931.1 hypothetical protein AO069_12190 [Pseudomonas syringae pv. syringae PD2774]PBP87949.1 hypothetical protein CCL16_11755 [Pseudomonas syringae]
MTTTVYDAIDTFITAGKVSAPDAQNLLSLYSSKVQAQLICAMYVGRDHIHDTELKEPGENYIGYTDHISAEDYSQIIYEKNVNVRTYLEKIMECARNSGFDLTRL